LLSQICHSCLLENIQRCLMGSQTDDIRIGKLPSIGAVHRDKPFLHFESLLLIMTPPSCKTVHIGTLSKTLMNKHPRNIARTRVHILVTTPSREIHVPVMKT